MASCRDETYWQLVRARDFMDANYDLPLDLEQIAREANFSRFHFVRLFNATFDRTPHQYLTERRIERARTLLAIGELSVTEVCYAVGFQSVGSFSTLFRRVEGCPPRAYLPRYYRGVTLPMRYIPACFMRLHRTFG